jgi:hypothetical protein
MERHGPSGLRSEPARTPSGRRALCRRSALLSLALVALLAPSAFAQAPGTSKESEDYRAEIAAGVWSASPDVVITSGTLGIDGSGIDFVGDLGLIRKALPQVRLVLKAAPRHKLRVGYVPTSYEAGTTLSRTISFGGTNFTIGVPVTASLNFQAWRFGYQYDVVSANGGFAGLIAELRYARVGTDVRSTFLGVESSLGDAFIPAVGGTGRIYLHRRVAVTGEVMWFEIPELVDGLGGGGRSVDFDVSGLVTFTRNFGVQAGYRTLDVSYRRRDDAGAVGLKGVYLSSLIRF